MTFTEWLLQHDFISAAEEESVLSAKATAKLKAQFDAEQKPADDPPNGKKPSEGFDEIIAAKKADRERIASITKLVKDAVNEQPGQVDEIEALGKAAIQGSTSAKDFELELLRDLRPSAPHGFVDRGKGQLNGQVIEAAICSSLRLEKLEEKYDERTLQAAHKHFRHGIGLQEVLLIAARANGYHGLSAASVGEVLRAAMPPVPLRAAGFSTIEVSGILSNVMNKLLLDHFNHVEQTWREIAGVRSVRNFHETFSYSLTGDLEYEEVGPAGEIPHGTLGQEQYGNRADTFAKMLAITRKDIINDDLGAFQRIPARLGRGGALKINDVFWREFMDNASFFTDPRGNYDEGADTVLDITGLTLAETLFLDQTDPNGKPLGVVARVLLTPNALTAKAAQLMNSTELRDTTSDTVYGVSNPHAGKFKAVRSSYLSNPNYPGDSTKAWYLLADPQDLAVIEVVFLNGRDVPMIESAEADFDTLGIKVRGVHDFGVRKQEYRGGVKMKGENGG